MHESGLDVRVAVFFVFAQVSKRLLEELNSPLRLSGQLLLFHDMPTGVCEEIVKPLRENARRRTVPEPLLL